MSTQGHKISEAFDVSVEIPATYGRKFFSDSRSSLLDGERLLARRRNQARANSERPGDSERNLVARLQQRDLTGCQATFQPVMLSFTHTRRERCNFVLESKERSDTMRNFAQRPATLEIGSSRSVSAKASDQAPATGGWGPKVRASCKKPLPPIFPITRSSQSQSVLGYRSPVRLQIVTQCVAICYCSGLNSFSCSQSFGKSVDPHCGFL